MQRQILFRGKRTDTGEWVQGFYAFLHNSNSHHIGVRQDVQGIEGQLEWVEVNPDTVGQMLSFTDKYGVSLFEGDICYFDVIGEPPYKNEKGLVSFGGVGWAQLAYCHNIRLIGNRFDHPLLILSECNGIRF